MTNADKFKEVFGYNGSIVNEIKGKTCGYGGCSEEACASRHYPRCPMWWIDEFRVEEWMKIKSKEELIRDFLYNFCDQNSASVIQSRLEDIWQNGYLTGAKDLNTAKSTSFNDGYKKGYEEGRNRISNKPVLEELFEVATDSFKKKEIEDGAYKRGFSDGYEKLLKELQEKAYKSTIEKIQQYEEWEWLSGKRKDD